MFGRNRSLFWKVRALVLCAAVGAVGFYGWHLYGNWQRGGLQAILVEEEPAEVHAPPVNWSLIEGVDLVVEISTAALSESTIWTRLHATLVERDRTAFLPELESLRSPVADVLRDVEYVLFSADVEFESMGEALEDGLFAEALGKESFADVPDGESPPVAGESSADGADLLGLMEGAIGMERAGELLHLSFARVLDEEAYRAMVTSVGEMMDQEVTEERFGDELGFRVGLISEDGFYVLWMPSRRDVLLSVSRLVLGDATERWHGRLEVPRFKLFDEPVRRRLGQVQFWFQVPASLSEHLGLLADAFQAVVAVGDGETSVPKPPLFGLLDPAFVRAVSSLDGDFIFGEDLSVELGLGFSDSTAASSLAVLLAAAADALVLDFDQSPLVVSRPVVYLQGAHKVVLKGVFSGRALNELAEDLAGNESAVDILP